MGNNVLKLDASILLVYTGGTIGMIEDPETGLLRPFNFNHLVENVPELKRFDFHIDCVQFDPPIDSSEIEPVDWARIAKVIADHYEEYDGFVILHGTDTMSFTASALSFMLEDLNKPVIFTGSQLPIGTLRTDGKENLITAIELAAMKKNHRAVFPEVCVFFERHLMRGNRTSKINADRFNAFRSHNYPSLAVAGIQININASAIKTIGRYQPLRPHYSLNQNVVILKLFPGIQPQIVEQILDLPTLKGVVLETYGSGNAPQKEWFLSSLRQAVERGVVIVNVTQCLSGTVSMERYKTGHKLQEIGVISGRDITTEAAVTKLMFLFGQGCNAEQVARKMNDSIAGEIAVSSVTD
jgi:L-asparaginases, type I